MRKVETEDVEPLVRHANYFELSAVRLAADNAELVASKSEIGERAALVERAEENLREKRGELIRKAAAETLLVLVEEEYQCENRPQVLNSAS